jgi:Uma2 family endonuclease
MPPAQALPTHPTHFDLLYAQLQQLPENMRGEIIDGQLYAMTRPFAGHGLVQFRLGACLARYDGRERGPDEPGGWLFQPEPELHLTTNQLQVVVPDLAGWRRTRLQGFPRGSYVTQAPDWVCEVLSEGTASNAQGPKRRIYHAAGVTWLWLIDPKKRTLLAERREGDLWMRVGRWQGTEVARTEPFPGVDIVLERLWDELAEE